MMWTFFSWLAPVVLASFCDEGVSAMPVEMPPAAALEIEPADGLIVVNVFAPEQMINVAENGTDAEKQLELARVHRLKEAAGCEDVAQVHYGITTAEGEKRFLPEDADGIKELESFILAEKGRIEAAAATKPAKIRIYVCADSRVAWPRVAKVIETATRAGITDVVFGKFNPDWAEQMGK